MQLNEALSQLKLLQSQYGEVTHRLQDVRELLPTVDQAFTVLTFARFEGILTKVGPELRVPSHFSEADSLATKLSSIGKRLGMDRRFRQYVERELLLPRNQALHGRPLHTDFSTVITCAKQFIEQCH
ncbi:MAG: hypothetical protein SFX74_03185 [Fimbriimonadaceae bacterium]|nr:hypothetical protein [Fimbriimonadaceae bacterium]